MSDKHPLLFSSIGALILSLFFLAFTKMNQLKSISDPSLFSILDASIDTLNASRDSLEDKKLYHDFFDIQLIKTSPQEFNINIRPKKKSPFYSDLVLTAILKEDLDHILRIEQHELVGAQ